MKVVVIKYNAGNICSVVNALRRVGVEPCVTDDPVAMAAADRIIFPGQGSAAPTMSYLRKRGLDAVIASLTQPVLGICIGQQLLCEHSDEGGVDCLGVFPDTRVQKFVAPAGENLKVPHMGWNSVEELRSPLFEGLNDGDFVYFVHSYYVPDSPLSIATTKYGGRRFSSAMRRGNFYATQFHPEKSGDVGERIIHNFIHFCHD